MREELAKRVGKRGEFRATYQRIGLRRGKYGTAVTALLINVRDEAGTLVTDHLWFIRGKCMEDLQLQAGDRVRFVATVSTYYKRPQRDGESFAEWDQEDFGVFEKDYKLIYPSNMRLIGHENLTSLPLFDQQEEAG